MPVVATGDQGYSVTTMLPPLMDAAVHWLRVGFPIEKIKLVVRNDLSVEEALPIFQSYSPAVSTKRAVKGAVAGVVGIAGGVVSGVFNPEDSGVDAPDRRPRHEKRYHDT